MTERPRVVMPERGDLVVVKWTDASDLRASLNEHLGNPEMICKDWGVFLGLVGVNRRFLLLGKDVVEVQNEWGATRIPLELVEEISVLLPKNRIVGLIREVQVLGRRVRLRKSRREVVDVRVA